MNGDPDEDDGRESRLDEAIVQYLEDVQAGHTPDREQFLARYPDLADELAGFLDDRDRIQDILPFPAAGPTDARSTSGPGGTDPFPLPHTLGRIELVAVIGRGGFATVYKGRDTAMGRWVAVKALRNNPLATPASVGRALREAEVAAQLTHHGIVQVHDVGRCEGVPYLVSEFIAGRTLAALIRDDRPPPDRAAEL